MNVGSYVRQNVDVTCKYPRSGERSYSLTLDFMTIFLTAGCFVPTLDHLRGIGGTGCAELLNCD